VPTINALADFIAAMSAIHPLRVRHKGDKAARELRTLQQVRSHLMKAHRRESDYFIFVSLLLLRASLSLLLDGPKKRVEPNNGDVGPGPRLQQQQRDP
jgi:hypothetical protein